MDNNDNMDGVCRICRNKSSVVSVFERKPIGSTPFHELVKTYCAIEIKPTDKISQKICMRCIYIIKKIHDYRSIALKNNEIMLKECVDKNTELDTLVKEEILHPSIKHILELNPNVTLPQEMPKSDHFNPIILISVDERRIVDEFKEKAEIKAKSQELDNSRSLNHSAKKKLSMKSSNVLDGGKGGVYNMYDSIKEKRNIQTTQINDKMTANSLDCASKPKDQTKCGAYNMYDSIKEKRKIKTKKSVKTNIDKSTKTEDKMTTNSLDCVLSTKDQTAKCGDDKKNDAAKENRKVETNIDKTIQVKDNMTDTTNNTLFDVNNATRTKKSTETSVTLLKDTVNDNKSLFEESKASSGRKRSLENVDTFKTKKSIETSATLPKDTVNEDKSLTEDSGESSGKKRSEEKVDTLSNSSNAIETNKSTATPVTLLKDTVNSKTFVSEESKNSNGKRRSEEKVDNTSLNLKKIKTVESFTENNLDTDMQDISGMEGEIVNQRNFFKALHMVPTDSVPKPSLSTTSNVLDILKIHKSTMVYMCKVCDSAFCSRPQLSSHMRKTHSTCPFCKKKFASVERKDEHVRVRCVQNLKPAKIILHRVDEVPEIVQKYPEAFKNVNQPTILENLLLSNSLNEYQQKSPQNVINLDQGDSDDIIYIDEDVKMSKEGLTQSSGFIDIHHDPILTLFEDLDSASVKELVSKLSSKNRLEKINKSNEPLKHLKNLLESKIWIELRYCSVSKIKLEIKKKASVNDTKMLWEIPTRNRTSNDVKKQVVCDKKIADNMTQEIFFKNTEEIKKKNTLTLSRDGIFLEQKKKVISDNMNQEHFFKNTEEIKNKKNLLTISKDRNVLEPNKNVISNVPEVVTETITNITVTPQDKNTSVNKETNLLTSNQANITEESTLQGTKESLQVSSSSTNQTAPNNKSVDFKNHEKISSLLYAKLISTVPNCNNVSTPKKSVACNTISSVKDISAVTPTAKEKIVIATPTNTIHNNSNVATPVTSNTINLIEPKKILPKIARPSDQVNTDTSKNNGFVNSKEVVKPFAIKSVNVASIPSKNIAATVAKEISNNISKSNTSASNSTLKVPKLIIKRTVLNSSEPSVAQPTNTKSNPVPENNQHGFYVILSHPDNQQKALSSTTVSAPVNNIHVNNNYTINYRNNISGPMHVSSGIIPSNVPTQVFPSTGNLYPTYCPNNTNMAQYNVFNSSVPQYQVASHAAIQNITRSVASFVNPTPNYLLNNLVPKPNHIFVNDNQLFQNNNVIPTSSSSSVNSNSTSTVNITSSLEVVSNIRVKSLKDLM